MQKRLRIPRTLAFLVLLVLFSTDLQAVEIKGTQFADKILVEEIALSLQGGALLKWAGFINVYAGAFYLPEDQTAASWSDEVTKALELSYFREIKAEDFGSASDKLLRDSLSDAEYQNLSQRLSQFYGLFRDVKPGDRYRLIYQPGKGTELFWNNQLLGMAPGADFARAYFGIWLGEQPISKNFRDQLLAGAR